MTWWVGEDQATETHPGSARMCKLLRPECTYCLVCGSREGRRKIKCLHLDVPFASKFVRANPNKSVAFFF